MRDTLAMALVRAELCRARAADLPRPAAPRSPIDAHRALGRLSRAVHLARSCLADADDRARHAPAAPASTSPPD